jgi:hypothetical protein
VRARAQQGGGETPQTTTTMTAQRGKKDVTRAPSSKHARLTSRALESARKSEREGGALREKLAREAGDGGAGSAGEFLAGVPPPRNTISFFCALKASAPPPPRRSKRALKMSEIADFSEVESTQVSGGIFLCWIFFVGPFSFVVLRFVVGMSRDSGGARAQAPSSPSRARSSTPCHGAVRCCGLGPVGAAAKLDKRSRTRGLPLPSAAFVPHCCVLRGFAAVTSGLFPGR